MTNIVNMWWCKRVISIVFKINICESKGFIMLFRLILETEFLNHDPNNGCLTQIANFRLLSKIRSMIIQFNFRHTYGRLSGYPRKHSCWINYAECITSHSRVVFIYTTVWDIHLRYILNCIHTYRDVSSDTNVRVERVLTTWYCRNPYLWHLELQRVKSSPRGLDQYQLCHILGQSS